MRYSQLFGKTVKDVSADIKLASHRLLLQAGFIRESVAGRYYFLPLGMRVQDNIVRIIEEEMNRAGAQKMITPVLHPLELWKETNRTNTVGFELMTLKDQRGSDFALGGTAEEMMVDVVRKFNVSYKDLPFNIYQFSQKFRDEKRARGGLLRVREFLMKDAYSFHADEQDFKKEYQHMWETYTRIFERCGLEAVVVESDNGYIGGDYCHEFVVESDAGESKFFMTEDGSYAAHEEVAVFVAPDMHETEKPKPMEEVLGKGIVGVEELAKYLKIPVEKTTKTILFEDEQGTVIAAAVRGGYDINETKLRHIAGVVHLKLASPETVKRVTGAEVGYAGLMNLPKTVRIFMDESMKGRRNFEMGANRTNYHSINVNFGRDLAEPKLFYEFTLAKAGYTAPNGKQLIEKRGIEVGNIFQLGTHYSTRMKGATFVDADGKEIPYYMGCYGIGVGRTMGTIVELFHDDKGIVWPKSVTPFHVHLLALGSDATVAKAADELYARLTKAGWTVLFDDRDATAGTKFADSDLIGIPLRLVVSARTLAQKGVEWKERTAKESSVVSDKDLLTKLTAFYA